MKFPLDDRHYIMENTVGMKSKSLHFNPAAGRVFTNHFVLQIITNSLTLLIHFTQKIFTQAL